MGQLALAGVGAGIGFMVGGPTGASIGWSLGGFAWSLLDPTKIQGPRLQDTKVKGADYGVMRPIVYGTVRIGGIGMGQGSISEGPNKFTEHEESSGGKGGPEVVNFRYTLSFFDELCEGPIEAVLRRWGNGRLLNDIGGPSEDYPVVVYTGIATQMPDPTMETIYGVDEVNPMRGVAYEAVTELDVSEFGNARPIVEREVSTMPLTPNLRIIKSNYATGAVALNPGPGPTGGNYPVLIDWPRSGKIVVSIQSNTPDMVDEMLGGMTFDIDTFALDGSAVSTDSGLYRFPIGEGTPTNGGWQGVGMYQYTDHQLPLWQSSNQMGAKIEDFPVVTTETGGEPSGINFLEDAGVPGALYLSTCALSQDGYTFWAFTSAVSRTSASTHWYKIVEGLVVDDGTVSPAVSMTAWGNKCGISEQDGVMSVENNGEFFWYIDTTLDTVHIFQLDDTGNFAEWSGGTIEIPWPTPASSVYSRGTIKTLAKPGYAGAFFDDSIVLMSRLGPPEPVVLGYIVKDLLQRADRRLTDDQIDVTDLTQLVSGFIVGSQMTAKNAIDILRKAYFFDVTECDGKILCVNRGHDATDTIPDEDLCAHVPGTEKPDPLETVRVPEAELPRTVFINFYDVDHDYQQGSQYWRRTVTSSQSDVTLDLPLCFTASEALLRAQWHMHFAWLERDRFTFYVTDEWCKLRPTNVVVVRGVNIRLTNVVEMPDGVIRCEGVRAFAGPYAAPITDAASSSAPGGEVPGDGGGGQDPQEPPLDKVDTTAILLDIPSLSQTDAPFGFYAAMGPASDGPWAGATLYKSLDDGVTYAAAATTISAATMGATLSALDDYVGNINTDDTASSVDVKLNDADVSLSSVVADAFNNGANLCAIRSGATWELLQFRDATLIATDSVGRKTYTLDGAFKRGRQGTAAAIPGHAIGDSFVLLPVTNVNAPERDLNIPLKYKAVTFGKAIADAVAIDFTNTGVGADDYYDNETENLNTFVGDETGLGSPVPQPMKGLVPAPAIGDAALDYFLAADGTWKHPPPSTIVIAVAYSATTTIDLTNYVNYDFVVVDITLTGNITLNITNGTDGQAIRVRLIQDAGGSRLFTAGANLAFSTDTPSPTLSTTANFTDRLGFEWNGNTGKADMVAVNKGFPP